MHGIRQLGVLVVFLLLFDAGAAAFEADLGSRFADVYEAFSPLFLLHRSYADHLFLGTGVDVPLGLPLACQSLSLQLGLLQIDLVIQTASEMPETLQRILRLRVDQAAYCEAHGATLGEVAGIFAVEEPEALVSILETAADGGTFAGIQRLNDSLGEALDTALGELPDDIARWRFGVAFSMRSLLLLQHPERIDKNLREILYGSPDRSSPPIPLPDDVNAAMDGLMDLSGRDIAADEAAAAIEWARAIYDFILDGLR